jgi:hypothetical protein
MLPNAAAPSHTHTSNRTQPRFGLVRVWSIQNVWPIKVVTARDFVTQVVTARDLARERAVDVAKRRRSLATSNKFSIRKRTPLRHRPTVGLCLGS